MKTIKKTYYILTVVFLLWCAVSYLEIIIKNTASAPEYTNINLFIIFLEALTA